PLVFAFGLISVLLGSRAVRPNLPYKQEGRRVAPTAWWFSLVAQGYVGDTGVRRGRPCLVAVAIPKIGDHGAETAGHEPKMATRARDTPAGALACVAYVRVVISSCAFTCCVSRWKNSEPRYPI